MASMYDYTITIYTNNQNKLDSIFKEEIPSGNFPTYGYILNKDDEDVDYHEGPDCVKYSFKTKWSIEDIRDDFNLLTDKFKNVKIEVEAYGEEKDEYCLEFFNGVDKDLLPKDIR